MEDNTYYEYETLEGDTWDSISLDFFDDENYVSEIMAMNPEYISILIFSEGVILKIPALEKVDESSLPPWKRG
ncbi:tail protein X [Clostridium cylindrosporum]|uniref:Phage tail protein X n=1 Tax=Clostridium cylindrosporum DSM 605 TaxID=1121307 RepID=A0A0J8G5X9_CLOCY|nr:tail protein X [Clostridium cylindrosporum]KMT23011.1 phage tail protein X [Clostridium cylindrosporum DSM 605]